MPNPFRNVESTQIRYELYLPTSVKLVLYDASGRVVRKLVDSSLRMAGRTRSRGTTVTSAANSRAGHLYFYRLEAGGWRRRTAS